ncbi:alpha/beta fold hydrolase [Algirhabdus cladophorae]|uniref:alpha/beta fold hydrolase n=1 Tax=Algirhabdus cladophorae TaxID=3377108 RepID=UPI003B8451CF
MAHFLLIHGSCHGAWCWEHVLPALRDQGHTATAIDLPSHGADQTPVSDVTLNSYAQAILAATSGPTILVGHSMGGYPITKAAELDNANITALVYLCAYTPNSGVSLADNRRRAPRQPLLDAVIVSDDRQSFVVDPDKAFERFYHDCPAKDAERAIAQLCPQPILPQETAMTVTAASADLAQFYIRCSNDQTIPPEYQTTMAQAFRQDHVFDMPTSHSPFYADPAGLTKILSQIAGTL